MRKGLALLLLLVSLGGIPQILYAQFEVRGDLDLVLRNNSTTDITNSLWLGFSNFDFLRSRIFFDAKASDKTTILTQVLFDNEKWQLYGAYMRLDNMFDKKLNLNAGLIPLPVGTWGPRVYSFKNPVIGEPLLYHYHTALSTAYFQDEKSDLYSKRGDGASVYGLPMLYESWWGTGVELYGSAKKIDWSVGALTGSVSDPTVQRQKDIPQFTGKLGVCFSPEFTAILNVFAGPYLIDIPSNYGSAPTNNASHYLNSGAGVSLQYARGYLEVYSEAFVERWQHPDLGNLDAFSGYIDAKYKFATQWYLAGRAETMRFAKIDFGGTIGSHTWDIPLNKFEFGLGYKIDQALLLKCMGQIIRYHEEQDEYNDEEIAIQLSTKI